MVDPTPGCGVLPRYSVRFLVSSFQVQKITLSSACPAIALATADPLHFDRLPSTGLVQAVQAVKGEEVSGKTQNNLVEKTN